MGKKRDIAGKKFGFIIPIKPVGVNKFGSVIWQYRCDCGNIKNSPTNQITSGQVKSCGCYHKQQTSKANKKHGMSKTRQYKIWVGIIKRCYCKSNHAYKWYGAKGITMSKEWRESFVNFWEDMKHGYSDKLTIDRIDSNSGYYKNNCRWVSMLVQQNNRKNNHKITFKGKELTIAEISRKIGMNPKLIYRRLSRGWSIEKTIKTPKFTNRYY